MRGHIRQKGKDSWQIQIYAGIVKGNFKIFLRVLRIYRRGLIACVQP